MTDLHRSAAWSKFARMMRPRIRAQGEAPCIRCGRLIDLTHQPWDLGHIRDVVTHPDLLTDPENVGPEHRHRTGSCIGNRSAGGSLGRARQTARERRRKDVPQW